MRTGKRAIIFIIFNIGLSVLTTLTVLWIWDNSKRDSGNPVIQLSVVPPISITLLESNIAPTTIITLPPIENKIIKIDNVYGGGDLQQEVVILKYVGSDELVLSGWQIRDNNNHVYTFGNLRMYKNSTIEVYTRPGPNNLNELNWNLDAAIWHSGNYVSLYDPDGNLRDRYHIP